MRQKAISVPAGLALSQGRVVEGAVESSPVRIGVIGLGTRGTSLLRTLLELPAAQVVALCEAVAALLVAAEVVILLTGVVSRYVFNNPFFWTDELANFLFLWLSMLGTVVALLLNFPSLKAQQERITAHASAAILMASILFAAGAFTGIMKGAGMVNAMASMAVQHLPQHGKEEWNELYRNDKRLLHVVLRKGRHSSHPYYFLSFHRILLSPCQ